MGESTITSGMLPEQTRVLNTLNMFTSGALGDPNEPGGRMRVLPLMCKTVLAIRKLNRKLIDQLAERSWTLFDKRHPATGDEILVRFDDPSGIHVELLEWTDEDEEFYDFAGRDESVAWMKLPGLE